MKVRQPRVGYINPKTLEVEPFNDGGRDAGALESVENISSTLVGTVVNCMTSFKLGTPAEKVFPVLWAKYNIRGLDDNSIINAVHSFNGRINPDKVTIQNVRTMVERSVNFSKNLEREAPGSFHAFMMSGSRPTQEDVREVLRCYCAEIRSARAHRSQNIRYLAIYNPRLNEVYRVRVDHISGDAITAVEKAL
jgi:hypothetical protein